MGVTGRRVAGAGTRLVQRVSTTRVFARVAPYALPTVDRAVHRLSGGRTLMSGWLLPSLMLTTTGARSGLLRRTPLVCVPEPGGTWLLVGSNFGRAGHPAWSANLIAHPRACVDWRGEEIAVGARLLAGAERQAAWSEALRWWPPYATYQSRVTREIRLFRLTRR
ncbi:nitroreductase family deazaflavin-dependent oxidoreductase [Streptomyces sp. NPDC127068]|uniref:nitroreductase family deazaflavin-dependent oxidoreductase n=1 Tax=Streptomyces sp. NPDC127068 TaxID=3347127 RepID=UPI0036471DE5